MRQRIWVAALRFQKARKVQVQGFARYLATCTLGCHRLKASNGIGWLKRYQRETGIVLFCWDAGGWKARSCRCGSLFLCCCFDRRTRDFHSEFPLVFCSVDLDWKYGETSESSMVMRIGSCNVEIEIISTRENERVDEGVEARRDLVVTRQGTTSERDLPPKIEMVNKTNLALI